MIHRFLINNFQSIREDVELDFRIPGTTPEMPCFRRSRSRPNVRLPSVIALVGPNGSGKTTLLRAMAATVRFMAYSFDYPKSDGIPTFVPFLAPETQAAPTRIETDFEAAWLSSSGDSPVSLFRYTLELERDEANLAATRINREALYIFPKGRPRRLIERKQGEPVYVAREMGLRPRDDRLSSIPENASVIASLARMGVDPFTDMAKSIGNMQTNIAGPDPWKPDTEVIARHYLEQQDLMNKVSDKLRRLDLGIKGMNILPKSNKEWLMAFDHHGLNSPVALSSESGGTRHLVHTFPPLNYALETGNLAIMDALDSDFHADLSMEILNWFRKKESNPKKAQLICALHNLSVLDDLEKEEVFIVEKSRDGATRAYGARDIAGLRRGSNLQKQYRSGALGGLPAFG